MTPLKIAITTGDADGIGTEVVAKALSEIQLKRNVHFYFYRTPKCPKKHLALIDRKFYRKQVNSIHEAIKESHIDDTVFFDISVDSNPAYFVKEASELCQNGVLDAIVTGPLSKPLITQSGLGVIGHTGLFRQMVKDKPLFMAFLGEHFNVSLVTDHVPLGEVTKHLSPELVVQCIIETHKLKQRLSEQQAAKPMALVGLNPHAGDLGVIGQEEVSYFNAIISECRSKGINVEGPVVPDVAFQRQNWDRYSFYISMYHDQGLIPFKLVHGQDSGVHVTLGLPFIRTSVDHGTAKDIFNQDKAESKSMLEAIEWALGSAAEIKN
tara:strand:+ start:110998 stop:111966 length:969 start_codon:yes stop_codon:yes gene_type:complete